MRRRGAAVCAGISIALGFGLAPAAQAWSTPELVSGGSIVGGEYEVAVDDEGDSVYAFQLDDGTIRVRTRSAAGTRSAVTRVVTSPNLVAVDGLELAVDADGDAVVGWLQAIDGAQRLRARTFSKDGVLGPIRTLTPPGFDASYASVAMTDGGDAIFAWHKDDVGLANSLGYQTRTLSASGSLRRIIDLTAPGEEGGPMEPQIAVNSNGDVIFAFFTSRTAPQGTRIRARFMRAGGRLGPEEGISGASASRQVADPAVGIAADGDAVFAWIRSDGNENQILTRARSRAGQLSHVGSLFAIRTGTYAYAPKIAVEADGDALIAWAYHNANNDQLRARTRFAPGGFSNRTPVVATGNPTWDLAAGATGPATITWSLGRTFARTISTAGDLGPKTALTGLAAQNGIPRLDVNPAGAAAVAYGYPAAGSNQLRTVLDP